MPVVLPAPPAPPPVLADYQLLYNGLLMGQGTQYRVNVLDGLGSLPDMKTTDTEKLGHHGDFSGVDLFNARTVTMTLTARGTSVANLETILNALKFACRPLLTGTLPMLLKLPGQGQRRIYTRARKRAISIVPTYNRGWCKVDLEFYCPDPRIYDDTLTTTVIAFGYGSIVNAGNLESRPVVTVTPSASAVGIANVADASALVLVDTTLGPIPSPCIVDMLARTVTDSGGANRFDCVAPTSTWPALVPGTNTIAVSGGSTSWAWRSAWDS
jgi:phage-related protein